MKVFIASDHAGFDVKEKVKSWLDGIAEVVDLGPESADRVNYPDYASATCKKVKQESGSRGILICGSGIGMSITANRYSHIRAALCRTVEEAGLSREHNDANVLCLGARTTEENLLKEIVKTWMSTEFAGGRHSERIALFDSLGEN